MLRLRRSGIRELDGGGAVIKIFSRRAFPGLLAGAFIAAAALPGAAWAQVPPGWTSEDINTATAGTAMFNNADGVWTIEGNGADIWNNADQFRYTHLALSGDGSITARVLSIEATDVWAKAGVMIRQSTAAGSVHAFMPMTSANGASFQRRLATDGASTASTDAGLNAPYWVRLVRAGDNFSAFRSADGNAWTQVGPTESIPMGGANVRVGLAVTSHAAGTLCTATFDRVIVMQGATVLFEWRPDGPVLSGLAGDGSNQLTWTTVTGASGYALYAGTAPGTYDPTPIFTGAGTQMTHNGLTNGTTYYYSVIAVVNGQDSAPSNELALTPQSTVPRFDDHKEGLIDGNCGCGSVGNGPGGLSWTAALAALALLLGLALRRA
jgi:hypothetical protein